MTRNAKIALVRVAIGVSEELPRISVDGAKESCLCLVRTTKAFLNRNMGLEFE